MNQQNHQLQDDEDVLDGAGSFAGSLHTVDTLQSLIQAIGAGLPASKLFGQGITYTYDDVIFHPGHIYFGAHEAPSFHLAFHSASYCAHMLCHCQAQP